MMFRSLVRLALAAGVVWHGIVSALRASGVDPKDPRLQRGIAWLKANQRESGRWWTRSLNTDSWHFISYSGTAYPLLALAACGELPAKQ